MQFQVLESYQQIATIFLRDEPDENTGNDLVKPQTSQNALVEKGIEFGRKSKTTLSGLRYEKRESVTSIGKVIQIDPHFHSNFRKK